MAGTHLAGLVVLVMAEVTEVLRWVLAAAGQVVTQDQVGLEEVITAVTQLLGRVAAAAAEFRLEVAASEFLQIHPAVGLAYLVKALTEQRQTPAAMVAVEAMVVAVVLWEICRFLIYIVEQQALSASSGPEIYANSHQHELQTNKE